MGFFDSHFFPFLGPTADKTRFANLEELKKEHKIRHHSSVVGFYALSWPQFKFKNYFGIYDAGLGKLYRSSTETLLSMIL